MTRARRPMGRLAGLVIGIGFILVGLLVFLTSALMIAGELGPRTTSTGQLVNLTTSTSARTGTSYEVDLAWGDGEQGSLISENLYASVYPLNGPVSVTIDHSSLTGKVIRVQLNGTWYESDDVPAAGTAVIGLAGLAFAVWLGRLLFRVQRRGARAR